MINWLKYWFKFRLHLRNLINHCFFLFFVLIFIFINLNIHSFLIYVFLVLINPLWRRFTFMCSLLIPFICVFSEQIWFQWTSITAIKRKPVFDYPKQTTYRRTVQWALTRIFNGHWFTYCKPKRMYDGRWVWHTLLYSPTVRSLCGIIKNRHLFDGCNAGSLEPNLFTENTNEEVSINYT